MLCPSSSHQSRAAYPNIVAAVAQAKAQTASAYDMDLATS
jgi:hypothetical protein